MTCILRRAEIVQVGLNMTYMTTLGMHRRLFEGRHLVSNVNYIFLELHMPAFKFSKWMIISIELSSLLPHSFKNTVCCSPSVVVCEQNLFYSSCLEIKLNFPTRGRKLKFLNAWSQLFMYYTTDSTKPFVKKK